MADDTPQGAGPARDDGPTDAARRARTPPTIDLQAERVETASAPDGDSPQIDPPPARSARGARAGNIATAAGAGALAAAVVAGVAWYVGSRSSGSTLDTPLMATLETLGARLNRLEEAPAQKPRTDTALTGRIETLEKTVASLRDQVDAQRAKDDSLAQAVDALKVAPPQAAAATPAPAPAPDQEAAPDARVGQLETALKSLGDDIASLRATVKAAPVQPVTSDAVKAAEAGLRRAVSALALEGRVVQGAPFAAELAAVRASGSDDASLKPLDRLSESGVPDASKLGRDLLALIPHDTAQEQPAPSATQGGWFDRLKAGAMRLVRIRRVDSAGEAVAPDMTPLAAAARAGDVTAATREIAALPEAARARFQPWLDQVAARDAALAAAHRTVADALAALARTPAP